MTIGNLIQQLLVSGKSATETLETVRRVFPNCQTSLKCVYYYSSKLRKANKFDGLKKEQVIDSAELARALESIKAA